MTDEANSDDERIASMLRALPSEMPAPADLEARTIRALRRRGSIGRGFPARKILATAALVAVAFLGGWLSRSGNQPDGRAGHRYVLLLYPGDAEPAARDENVVSEYRQWAQSVRGDGRFVSGERLASESGVVLGQGRPDASAERLQGYFVIAAADDREAKAIAERHPHLRRGGRIVVRRIDPT